MNLQVEFYRASHSSRFPCVEVFGLGVLGGPQASGVMAYVSSVGSSIFGFRVKCSECWGLGGLWRIC